MSSIVINREFTIKYPILNECLAESFICDTWDISLMSCHSNQTLLVFREKWNKASHWKCLTCRLINRIPDLIYIFYITTSTGLLLRDAYTCEVWNKSCIDSVIEQMKKLEVKDIYDNEIATKRH